MKGILLLTFFLLLQSTIVGQGYKSNANITTTFSTKDGLPSNFIYDLCQDKFGYLWIATDNGISCFDGKRFKNYSTKNGLPSNDVLQIVLDGNGTIWANCYKQAPSYFDTKNNRFVSFEDNLKIAKISSDFISNIQTTKYGILFENKKGTILFKGKLPEKIRLNNSKNQPSVSLIVDSELFSFCTIKPGVYNVFKGDKPIGNLKYDVALNNCKSFYRDGVIYTVSESEITLTKPSFKPVISSVVSQINVTNDIIKRVCFSGAKIVVICNSGKILIYDNTSLKLFKELPNSNKANTALVDKNQNYWIGTQNEGLIYNTNSNLTQINHSESMNLNIQKMTVTGDGSLIFGNLASQIETQFQNQANEINTILNNNSDSWCRGIHILGKRKLAVFDNGVIDLDQIKNTFVLTNGASTSFKTSEKLNDSILLLGNFQGLYKFNINTQKFTLLANCNERILTIKRINNFSFFFIAEKGVYKFNLATKSETLEFPHTHFNNEQITAIELTDKNLVWLSTSKGNLYLFKNKKPILKLIDDTRLPNTITSLLDKNNQLWIGSKSGIYTLDYSNISRLNYKTIGSQDGLKSNFINSLFYYDSTIYACTTAGISIIPITLKQHVYTIRPTIVSVKIEGKNKSIQNKYKLNSKQSNIVLELTGVDITGHLKNLQYAINGGDFFNLEGNFLTLNLKGGRNIIRIRALDKNNILHNELLEVEFNIAIPIHKRIWFWVLISILLTAFMVYTLNRRNINKQKLLLATEMLLQNQRRAITADLHDDIGATLSSLQLNSAIANKVIDTDIEKSKKLLSTIELQSQKMAEKISDFVWSIKSDEEQFMPLSLRIRNFASEILSPTEINYSLLFEPDIDKIKDFYLRKNILLIVKEGINNAVKYSKSQRLKVEIKLNTDHQILILIEDKGIGFDTSSAVGNGIQNMKMRTKELKGQFHIASEKNEGTRIQISLPNH